MAGGGKLGEKVNVVFVILWVMAFLGNLFLSVAMGNGHSTFDQNKAYALFNPVHWIGYNLGVCPTHSTVGCYFIPLVWFLVGVLVLGLYLPRMRGRLSPFWALLLIPAVTGLSWLMTIAFGWLNGP